uniref:Uncharacterized protein n=1 Tax=Siphoviridae sp. ctpGU1 TaxID=2823601 RepID=A0A8S5LC68_9CAUD|nr:MAG TPA: hypothetical protein [Siphoviridae sp. ctpGU1]
MLIEIGENLRILLDNLLFILVILIFVFYKLKKR